MKITFLGTSAGMPDADRHCSSTMIEIGDHIYLVDGGAPLVDCFRQRNVVPQNLKAFFNTHGHSDHLIGFLHLLDVCTWFYRDTRFDFYVTEQEIADTFIHCVSLMEAPLPFPHDRLRAHVATEGTVYDDGVLKVTYIPTRHCEPHPSYAILLEAEGKKVLFSGDLSARLAKNDLPLLLSEETVDLFVCEMAHFTPAQLEPYLDTCLAKLVCFQHFCPPEKKEQTLALAKEKQYAFPVHFLRDGEVILL